LVNSVHPGRSMIIPRKYRHAVVSMMMTTWLLFFVGGVDTSLDRHLMDAIAMISRSLAEKMKASISNLAWHPR
jgi:hypothetical protein